MSCHPARVTASLLLLISLTTGCQSAGPGLLKGAPGTALLSDRLFFGRSIPSGGRVSDAQWEDFLRTVVTPRFPKGLTILSGSGQWLSPRGDLVQESVFIVEIFHERSDELESSIAAIATEYRTRFGQDAVLRATTDSQIRFY